MYKDLKSFGEPQVQHPSLEGMIAWMETKPPSQRYFYGDAARCLCSQYYRETGLGDFETTWQLHGDEWAEYLDSTVAMPPGRHQGMYSTVGAALKRARSYLG